MQLTNIERMGQIGQTVMKGKASTVNQSDDSFDEVLHDAQVSVKLAPSVQIDEDYESEQLHEDTEKVLKDSGSASAAKANEEAGSTATSSKTSLADIFVKASEKYGVPYNLLVAVAKAESNFQPNATSKSGAQGIMQLMPATAKFLGVKDAYDPEQNIMGGAKYLSDKLKEQDGDVARALACYNAGSAAVKKYDGVPPYEETQNYVKIVQKYMNSDIAVPDKEYTTSAESSETKNGTESGTESGTVSMKQAAISQTLSPSVLAASQVADTDMSAVEVILGEGDEQVTLSYEAYQRYLELMSIGVG